MNINPYLTFNNAIRRLILVQGQDGDVVVELLDRVEKFGARRFRRELLNKLKPQLLKIYAYDRATRAALLNWTSGIANRIIKYNV